MHESVQVPRAATTFKWPWLVIVVAALVVVVLPAVAIPKPWQAVGDNGSASAGKESEAAARLKFASAAVVAADDAKTAVDEKAILDKVLLDKILAANAATLQAAADKTAVEKQKVEKPGVESSKEEEKAKASQDHAANAEKDRVIAADRASEAAKKATDAVAAAKESLQRAQANLPLTGKSQFGWTGFVLVSLLLGLLFPLSAFAFLRLEVPRLEKQLDKDCDLLGCSLSGRWDWCSYLIHYSLTVFATILGVALFFRQPDTLLEVNTQRAMQFGFLGAYVYCMNLVYRRYTTLDMQPQVYLYCTAGLIAGMVFNFVAFTAITNVAASTAGADVAEFKGIGAGVAAILAFSLGYFPNLAIRWFGRVSRTSVHERQRRSDALPLSLIDGISELHESRLQDEGIDNVQNLATANIPELVAKTPFTAQGIVEWTDQAVLYLYLDPGEIESFRRAGVRTVSDFQDIWNGLSLSYQLQSDGTFKRIPSFVGEDAVKEFEGRRKAIAQQLATTEERLDSLFRATEQGPNMDYVRTYLVNVQTATVNTREHLINQICGRVGRAVRECVREGDALTSASLLKEVAKELFLATTKCHSKQAVDVTAESLYGRAYLKSQVDRTAESRELYEQCIKEFPNDPVAYNDLAWLDLHTLSQRSSLLRARDYAAKAVKLAKQSNPPLSDLAGYLDTLAFAFIRLGDPDSGRKHVEEAMEEWKKLSPRPESRFLETLVSAAEAYLSKGDKVKAKEVLDFVDSKEYASETTKKRITALRQ